MSYELRELIAFLAFIFAVVIATLVVICGIIFSVDAYQCRGLGRETGLEVRWDAGCYVHVDQRWVPSKYVFGDAYELRIKDGEK